MDQSLLDLLRAHHDPSSQQHTHVTLYGPSAKWSIPDSNYASFWRSYCNLVEDKEIENLCLAEIPKQHVPIMAEFMLKFHPLNKPGETYGNEFILSVVYCFQQAILRVLQISDSAMELICTVLDSDEYMEDNLVISRFKLQFPYCKTLPAVQTRTLRPLVLQMLRTENVISRLPQQPVNDWEAIIDPLTVEKPILLYGSSALPNIPKLKLEHIYTRIEQADIDNDRCELLELGTVFYTQNHEHVQHGIVPATMFAEEDRDFWLPMFLSPTYWKGVTMAKQAPPEILRISNHNSSDNFKPTTRSTGYSGSGDTPDGEETFGDMAERFLTMLSRDRIENDHYWLDVGRSLYGTFEGSERGLELWTRFTEKSDNHTPEECQNLYPTFNGTKLTVKTLAWYARIDSFEEYDKWHKSWYSPSLEKATSGLDADVAEALYRVYWIDFACSSLTKANIYHYKNNIWKKLDSGHTLRSYISGDFISIFEKFRTVVSIKIQDSTDRNFKDSAETIVKKISNLIMKLKKRTCKNNILGEVLEKFYIEEFEEKLDSNPELMGMVNGVLEAGDTEAVVRPGKPEDYVSKSTGLCWRYDLHWKHPLVVKLLEWLTKVFPNKELLEYFGKIGGACIKGKNSNKLLPVMTGQGDNSKSMIKKVFEAAFGAYCITFPTSLFTGKRTGGPDPAVARSKYAHIAFAQEPDADDPLKNGTIKEMTGGDRMFTRFLHDNGGEITPMFTLIFMCNTVPIIPHSDKAMKNRVRLVPFLSTWVKDPPKTTDEQYKKRLFKIDPYFEAQIPELAPAFMWYLVQMYGKYRKEGLIEPEIVTKSTTEYWNDNDIYLQFISENITRAYLNPPADWPAGKEKPIDEEAKISVADMYARFRDWFKESFNSLRCPDRQIVKSELEQRMGKTFQRHWHGINLKVDIATI